jgi:hypothetical protein
MSLQTPLESVVWSDKKQQCISVFLQLREKANKDPTFTSRIVLFRKLEMKLKEHFETVSDIKRESLAVLNSIKESYFCGAFEVWKELWDHCIHF